MDAQIATIIVALLINVPTWLMLRANSRKAGSDAYSTLLDALQKSGQTIEDLFSQLAEVPQLRSELKITGSELKVTKSDLELLKKQFVIMVSFGREHWAGSKLLHKQVVDRLPNETPAFVPAEKFITGPLIDKVVA